MTLKEFIKLTNRRDSLDKPRPRIVCNDGFSLSVQAGNRDLACEPQRWVSIYKSLEIGFPSEADPILLPYVSKYNSGIYDYVPWDVVEELLEKHGGINEEKIVERYKEIHHFS